MNTFASVTTINPIFMVKEKGDEISKNSTFYYMYRKPNHRLLAHLLTAIYSIIQYDFRKPDNQKLPAYIPTAVYFISNIPKLTIIIVE